MFSKPKSFLLLIAVVAIVAVGAFAVYAQDTTTPTQPPFGMMGHHGMTMSTHQMWNGDSAPMFTEIAKALGIDEQTLASELQSGKTLAQLAQEKGIDLTTVTAVAQSTMKQHLDALVTSGVLTQAQADARLSLMQAHWAEMPMFSVTGYGMMTGMGHGSMWGDDRTPHGMMGHDG